MSVRRRLTWILIASMLLNSTLLTPGCMFLPSQETVTPPASVPRELTKVSHPPYVLEPPDIILIDALRLVPKGPYKVEPLDALFIQSATALKEPIAGVYAIDPDGTVNLGFSYGAVQVAGMMVQEAKKAIEEHLKPILVNPVVNVSLAQSRGLQMIRGDHLIRPDGTVGLGLYGSVYIAGLTLEQAKEAIETHLSKYMQNPQVAVDVFSYNSKNYYVIFDGGGFGEQVYKLPVTGNETVLDALGNTLGLPIVANKQRIWVARPAPAGHPCDQLLPVDWKAITQRGETDSNYQLLPGDRIYVQAQRLITFDTQLTRILTPFERMFGFTLLGAGTISALKFTAGTAGGNGAGAGGL
jgi:polysaccharide export outer membrane protein